MGILSYNAPVAADIYQETHVLREIWCLYCFRSEEVYNLDYLPDHEQKARKRRLSLWAYLQAVYGVGQNVVKAFGYVYSKIAAATAKFKSLSLAHVVQLCWILPHFIPVAFCGKFR